jgi:hypothetical protein
MKWEEYINKEICAIVKGSVERNCAGPSISFVVTKHHQILFETKIQRINKIRWKIIHFISGEKNSITEKIKRNDWCVYFAEDTG